MAEKQVQQAVQNLCNLCYTNTWPRTAEYSSVSRHNV